MNFPSLLLLCSLLFKYSLSIPISGGGLPNVSVRRSTQSHPFGPQMSYEPNPWATVPHNNNHMNVPGWSQLDSIHTSEPPGYRSRVMHHHQQQIQMPRFKQQRKQHPPHKVSVLKKPQGKLATYGPLTVIKPPPPRQQRRRNHRGGKLSPKLAAVNAKWNRQYTADTSTNKYEKDSMDFNNVKLMDYSAHELFSQSKQRQHHSKARMQQSPPSKHQRSEYEECHRIIDPKQRIRCLVRVIQHTDNVNIDLNALARLYSDA